MIKARYPRPGKKTLSSPHDPIDLGGKILQPSDLLLPRQPLMVPDQLPDEGLTLLDEDVDPAERGHEVLLRGHPPELRHRQRHEQLLVELPPELLPVALGCGRGCGVGGGCCGRGGASVAALEVEVDAVVAGGGGGRGSRGGRGGRGHGNAVHGLILVCCWVI